MNDLLALGIFGPRWPRPLEDCQVHRGHADGVRQLVGELKAKKWGMHTLRSEMEPS